MTPKDSRPYTNLLYYFEEDIENTFKKDIILNNSQNLQYFASEPKNKQLNTNRIFDIVKEAGNSCDKGADFPIFARAKLTEIIEEDLGLTGDERNTLRDKVYNEMQPYLNSVNYQLGKLDGYDNHYYGLQEGEVKKHKEYMGVLKQKNVVIGLAAVGLIASILALNHTFKKEIQILPQKIKEMPSPYDLGKEMITELSQGQILDSKENKFPKDSSQKENENIKNKDAEIEKVQKPKICEVESHEVAIVYGISKNNEGYGFVCKSRKDICSLNYVTKFERDGCPSYEVGEVVIDENGDPYMSSRKDFTPNLVSMIKNYSSDFLFSQKSLETFYCSDTFRDYRKEDSISCLEDKNE